MAIVHDWLVTNAGAEKVLRALIDIYPDADIFSLVDFLNQSQREAVLGGKYAKTSFIQKLPFAKNHFRNYFFLFPIAIESFDLSGYDLIISSSWAVAKGVKRGENQLHISYCHTPIRYAWDLYEEYTKELRQPKKLIVQATLQYIKKWDIRTLGRVDYFIANSFFVQERIKRIYSRDSDVIYPPIEIDRFDLCEVKEDYYLTASRLVPYKKIDIIAQAFAKMKNKKLIIIGDGPEYKKIKSFQSENIIVLGYQNFDILNQNMQKAKAFIFAAKEDFGIVPLESQACGTPVIAFGVGGATESVNENKTGIFFYEQTPEAIIEAVEKFEKNIDIFDPKTIRENTKRFSKERFKQQIKEFIDLKKFTK